MDQIRYVGEWHSHSRAFSISPSATDVVQLCRAAITTALESQPGLSLIIGDTGLNIMIGDKL